MIYVPGFAEQYINSRYVRWEWGIGLLLDEDLRWEQAANEGRRWLPGGDHAAFRMCDRERICAVYGIQIYVYTGLDMGFRWANKLTFLIKLLEEKNF
jgi:hypothetical protein